MRRWIPGIAIVVLSLGSTSFPLAFRSASAHDDTSTVAAADRFVGRYLFIGGQAEHDALLAAIEGIVTELPLFLQFIARSRLRDANPIPGEIVIGRDGGTLVITLGEKTYRAPLDGRATDVVGITGEELRYRVEVAGDRIEQAFTGKDGGRRNRLVLGEGGRLGLHVVITSNRLPHPLRYRLSFRRT